MTRLGTSAEEGGGGRGGGEEDGGGRGGGKEMGGEGGKLWAGRWGGR